MFIDQYATKPATDTNELLNQITQRGGKTFYLYTHSYPDGRIFYVGKGVGDRARDFYQRNSWHKGVCKKIGVASVVVKVYPTVDERHALAVERQLILAIRRAGITLCNLTDGGDNESGREFTDEHKRKLSLAGTGVKKSPETIEKMRLSRLGKKMPESHRQKMRERKLDKQVEAMRKANIGRPVSEETKKKIGMANKGRSASLEAREKMRLAKLGKKHDPATIEKRSIALKAAWAKKKLQQEAV